MSRVELKRKLKQYNAGLPMNNERKAKTIAYFLEELKQYDAANQELLKTYFEKEYYELP